MFPVAKTAELEGLVEFAECSACAGIPREVAVAFCDCTPLYVWTGKRVELLP